MTKISEKSLKRLALRERPFTTNLRRFHRIYVAILLADTYGRKRR